MKNVPEASKFKSAYKLLRDPSKRTRNDYSNVEKATIRSVIAGIGRTLLCSVAAERGVALAGDRLLILRNLANSMKEEEFFDTLSGLLIAPKNANIKKLEMLGTFDRPPNVALLVNELRTKFKSIPKYAGRDVSIGYKSDGQTLLLVFYYPVKGFHPQWHASQHDYIAPQKILVQLDFKTGEILASPATRRKEGFLDIWSIIMSILKVKEPTKSLAQSQEAKRKLVECQTKAKEAVFLGGNDNGIRLTLRGIDCIGFFKNTLGESYPVFLRKFKLVEGVGEDDRTIS